LGRTSPVRRSTPKLLVAGSLLGTIANKQVSGPALILGQARCQVATPASAMIGTKAAAAGIENVMARRRQTWWSRACAPAPTAAASATTISEAVEAGLTGSSRM